MKQLLILLMIIVYQVGVCQEVPCRKWYTKTDRNGNTVKVSCEEAWNVNSNGQKHGKYIQYHENGNPYVVSNYVNGLLNGKYTEYKVDGTSIVLEGSYANEERNGNWKIGNSNGSFKDGVRVGIWKYVVPHSGLLIQDRNLKTFSYTQFSNEFKGSLKDGQLNGECLVKIDIETAGTRRDNGKPIFHAKVFINGFDQLIDKLFLDHNFNAEDDLIIVEGFSHYSLFDDEASFLEEAAFKYPLKIDKDTFTDLVNLFHTKYNLTSIIFSLKFSNGILDNEYSSLVFNSDGQKIGQGNVLLEAKQVGDERRKKEGLELAAAKKIEDANKEKELKERPDRDAYNQAVKYGSIEAYLYYIENFPNGIYSSEIKQVIKYGKFLFFQNTEGVPTREVFERYANGSKNKIQFIQPKNSTFKIDLTQPKSLWVRDTIYQVVFEKSTSDKYLFDLILYYNEALSDECPESILMKYSWASTIQTAIEATIEKNYDQSNSILKSMSRNYLTDFLTGINYILLGDKKLSKDFIKSTRLEATLPNNQYLPAVYQQVGHFIDMLVSNGIPKEAFQKLATFENDVAKVSEGQIASFTK